MSEENPQQKIVRLEEIDTIPGTIIKRAGKYVLVEQDEFTAQLVEVTENEDFTGDPGQTVRELMATQLEYFSGILTLRNGVETPNGIYHINNGLIVVISDKLNSTRKPEVFVGITRTLQSDPERKEQNSYALYGAGFKHHEMYVPLSFEGPEKAREYLNQIIREDIGSHSGLKHYELE